VGVHSGNQFARAEGFYDIVVCADAQTTNLIDVGKLS
jgi:hypothetical protein